MSALIYRINFSFWAIFWPKTGSFRKVSVETAKNSKNDPTKTVFNVKISILSEFPFFPILSIKFYFEIFFIVIF
jgi:hypothetical protein